MESRIDPQLRARRGALQRQLETPRVLNVSRQTAAAFGVPAAPVKLAGLFATATRKRPLDRGLGHRTRLWPVNPQSTPLRPVARLRVPAIQPLRAQ